MTSPGPGSASIVPGDRPEGTADGPGRTSQWLARHLVRAWARRLGGALVLEDTPSVTGPGSGGAGVHVSVHDHRAYGALLRRGSVGLAEGYVESWWDCDDLTGLVRLLVANRGALGRARDRLGAGASIFTDPLCRLGGPSKADDGRHVRAHYDLGNELFALILDKTMSYSCALFAHPGVSLAEASEAKLERICNKLGVGPGDHVVEIGTGWGGFALHAAARHGCRVTTTTVSAEQHSFATKRVAEAGLTHLVTVLNDDYRDLRGTYDKLVSIEMVEAVGWRQLPGFFQTCANLLAPGGLMALQAITVEDRSYERAKHTRDFIKEMVFPGSCLPSVTSLTRSAGGTDLQVIDLEDIGGHYAETLRHWRANLDAHEAEVAALGFGPRFLRLWRLYLSYCEAGFLERHISDVQILLARPAWRGSLGLRP